MSEVSGSGGNGAEKNADETLPNLDEENSNDVSVNNDNKSAKEDQPWNRDGSDDDDSDDSDDDEEDGEDDDNNNNDDDDDNDFDDDEDDRSRKSRRSTKSNGSKTTKRSSSRKKNDDDDDDDEEMDDAEDDDDDEDDVTSKRSGSSKAASAVGVRNRARAAANAGAGAGGDDDDEEDLMEKQRMYAAQSNVDLPEEILRELEGGRSRRAASQRVSYREDDIAKRNLEKAKEEAKKTRGTRKSKGKAPKAESTRKEFGLRQRGAVSYRDEGSDDDFELSAGEDFDDGDDGGASRTSKKRGGRGASRAAATRGRGRPRKRGGGFDDDDEDDFDNGGGGDSDDDDFDGGAAGGRSYSRGAGSRRSSSRKSSTQGAYKEQGSDDEDLMEDDEVGYDPNAYAAVGYGPKIEKILAMEMQQVEDEQGGHLSPRYLVKWKDTSYLHLSWESGPRIEELAGSKQRLARFRERWEWEKYRVADEGYFDTNYTEVERVIAHRVDDNGLDEFLVKWRSLPYCDCTWETRDTFKDDAKIEEFKKFDAIPERFPQPPLAAGRRRPRNGRFTPVTEASGFKNDNTLRAYQLEGMNWLVHCWYREAGCILADEMGLGKTVQAVTFLQQLFLQQGTKGPHLIVAPLSTVQHWMREIEAWTDMNCILYHGNQDSRKIIREYEWYHSELKGQKRNKQWYYRFNVLITTYEMAMQDDAIRSVFWETMILDEAHRLKNQRSRTFISLSSFRFDHCVLLTGTPLQNNTEELWCLMNFIAPEQFNNLDAFLEKYGEIKDEKTVNNLQQEISPYMLRRKKEDVEKSLPPKEETIIEVQMSQLQRITYKAILEKNFEFLTRGAKDATIPVLRNVEMELRKCCNHPYLVMGVEDRAVLGIVDRIQRAENLIKNSGKFILLDKMLPKLKEEGHKVLIFSQFVRVLDMLQEYLDYRGYIHERIDGGVKGNDRQSAIDRFSAPNSDRFVFLICTKAGGLGINLTAADTVIIFDSDWNPQNDLQAQARAHRIGQTREVKIYRLLMGKTYEKEMFERASLKLGLEQAILANLRAEDGAPNKVKSAQQKKEIERLLRQGAYDVFSEEAERESSAFCEESIDAILERRATKVVTQQRGETPSTALSFAKANFSLGEQKLSVDDPDFWEKLMPDAMTTQQKNLMMSELPRVRKQVQRLGIENLDDSDDDMGGGGGGGGGADDNYMAPGERKKLKTACGQAELGRFKKALVNFGYGRWEEIITTGTLRRSVEEVIALARDFVKMTAKLCNVDHQSIKAVVQADTSGLQPSHDPMFEGNFDDLRPMQADRAWNKLEQLFYAWKAVGGAKTPEEVNVPKLPGQPPAPWWTEVDDASLLLTIVRNGYDSLQTVATDQSLTLAKHLPPAPPPSATTGADGEAVPAAGDGAAPAAAPTTAAPVAPPAPKDDDKNDDDKDDDKDDDGTGAAGGAALPPPTGPLPDFPDVKEIRARADRLLRTLVSEAPTSHAKLAKKASRSSRAVGGGAGGVVASAQGSWNKNDSKQLENSLRMIGVPLKPDGEKDWERLREHAKLERHGIPEIKQQYWTYVNKLKEAAAAAQAKAAAAATGGPAAAAAASAAAAAAGIAGQKRAATTLRRLRMFELIRQTPMIPNWEAKIAQAAKAIKSRSGAVDSMQITITSIPWVKGEYDIAALKGLIKHDMNWDDVLLDDSLPFKAAVELQNKKIEERAANDKAQAAAAVAAAAGESGGAAPSTDDKPKTDEAMPDANKTAAAAAAAPAATAPSTSSIVAAAGALKYKEPDVHRRLDELFRQVEKLNPGTISMDKAKFGVGLDADDMDGRKKRKKDEAAAAEEKKDYHIVDIKVDDKLLVHSLGYAVPNTSFAAPKSLYPAGYQSTISWNNYEWRNEIVDTSNGPVFRVTFLGEDKNMVRSAVSPSDVWRSVVKFWIKMEKEKEKERAEEGIKSEPIDFANVVVPDGISMFGLDNPRISELIKSTFEKPTSPPSIPKDKDKHKHRKDKDKGDSKHSDKKQKTSSSAPKEGGTVLGKRPVSEKSNNNGNAANSNNVSNGSNPSKLSKTSSDPKSSNGPSSSSNGVAAVKKEAPPAAAPAAPAPVQTSS